MASFKGERIRRLLGVTLVLLLSVKCPQTPKCCILKSLVLNLVRRYTGNKITHMFIAKDKKLCCHVVFYIVLKLSVYAWKFL
jgi:hypothetical protein